MTISDILNKYPEEVHGNIVRTIGRLKKYDIKKSELQIEDFKTSLELVIDSQVIEPFPFKQDALYQFLGELDGSRNGTITLIAHVYRCVDDLDMNVYLKACSIRNC